MLDCCPPDPYFHWRLTKLGAAMLELYAPGFITSWQECGGEHAASILLPRGQL